MKRLKFLPTIIFSMFSAPALFAQATAPQPSFVQNNEGTLVFYTIILILIFLLFLVMFMSYMLINMVSGNYRQMLIDKGIIKENEVETPSWTEELGKSLTQAVPIEREGEIDLGHNYDGIRELDNRMPPWWLAMFYITIVWSVGYMLYYHVFDKGPLQIAEYEADMAIAELQREEYLKKAADKVNETTVTALISDADLAKGKQLYTVNCVACHGAGGEGGVGPNLTDKYWIHGGGIKNIFKVIKYGVIEKGMISWQTQLKPSEMQQVSSYILTLAGTNPPNAKEPQGAEYIEAVEAEAVTTDAEEVVLK
jgi:cytochrome c oxidase cbb3-type subunit III